MQTDLVDGLVGGEEGGGWLEKAACRSASDGWCIAMEVIPLLGLQPVEGPGGWTLRRMSIICTSEVQPSLPYR